MEQDNNRETDATKIQNAKEIAAINHQLALWTEQRSVSVGDEFIRLEVQIATILFAFSSLFLDKINSVNLPGIPLTMFKLAFSSSILFLLISLACGLLHLKTHEKFSDTMLVQRKKRYIHWRDVALGKATFAEAEAFNEGSKLGDGHVVSEPNWTWILQTISLGIGVSILFVLSLVFLFSH